MRATHPRIAMLLLVFVAALAPAPPAATAADLDDRVVATYDVDLFLAWSSRRIRVDTRLVVRNDGLVAVERLALNTLAARLGDMRRLRIHVDGVEVVPRVRGQTIRVPLPSPLGKGDQAVIDIAYHARLRSTTRGRDFLWSRAGGVAHVYRFIPWISRPVPFGPALHGEPFVTGVSPLVRVDVDSDVSLVWATSGQRTSRQGRRQSFVARDVRDFNIAASPGYRTRSGRSEDGRVRIIVHTRTADAGRLLRLARAELARFQRFTGVRYPYPIYRVAETGGGLAMESPAMAWIPGFRSPADQAFLVSHETAHQWFYAIIGNDQSTDAFADEAVAEYLSRTSRGVLRASTCPRDRLDRSIHGYRAGCYYETVYVQGALFLDSLRRDHGSARFRRAIREYARDHRLGMGSDRRLLEAFREEMGNGVLGRFRARFPSLY